MSDEITLTLPWKLAMHVKTLAHYERWTNPDCPPEMHVEWQAIIDAIDRQMLAASAEGPERAATGETLVRCGRCGAPFAPHPDPARFDHDCCEACLPEAVKYWGMMQTLPERRAAGEERGA